MRGLNGLSIIDTALELLHRGFWPVLYRPFEKKPLKTGWGEQPPSETVLRREFQRCPRAGVGVLLGPQGGLIDLDCDGRRAVESLRELFRGEVPETLGWVSERGPHRLFRWDDRLAELGTIKSEFPSLPDLEIRTGLPGKRAGSVVPPSPWRPGQFRRWEGPETIAELPQHVIATLLTMAETLRPYDRQKRRESAWFAAAFREEVSKVAQAAKGSRHKTLLAAARTLAGYLGHGFFTEVEVRAELASAAKQAGLPDDEINETIRDGLASGIAAPFPWPPALEGVGSNGRLKPERRGVGLDPLDATLAGKPLTDLGNCERLVARFDRDIRYVAQWRKPLTWDGTRWAIDEGGVAIRYAKQTARLILREATTVDDATARAALAKWSLASESRGRLEAMLALALPEPSIIINHTDLNTNPWLLNVRNGTVNLKDGSLNPHRRDDLITQLCPVELDLNTDCPLWKGTLDLVFQGDLEMILFFQQLCGCCLTGDVSEQILPIFHGEGNNGKSTLMETMLGVLGPDYAMSANQDFLMAKKFRDHSTEIMSLFGKRLVVASETGEDRRLDEPLVKRLTGSDEIRGRRMREDEWGFKPTHKLFLSTNHEPRVRGSDHAIWRRLLKIPCTYQIPTNRVVKGMADRLKEEYQGILAWAIQGCVSWVLGGGLNPPLKVTQATEEYQAEQDELFRWLEECCQLDPDGSARASDLYASYKTWAEQAGEHAVTKTMFGRRLTRRGLEKRVSDGIIYDGIKLLPQPKIPDRPR